MKLLSYHIENYGKIHEQDGDFLDGLTCVCERNGFGKSTMASFLKAMFYGLASYTKSTKEFTERQRYYPFSGGKFGGNLTFEYEGDVYRIERFFDKKSARGDECKVYKNGAIYDGFGEEIGKSIFGVDEESFKKTVFITVDEVEISSTHSINEKLNGTVDGTDENGFERAIEALDKAKKNLKAARGGGGKINELNEEILKCEVDLKNLRDMHQSLSAIYKQRDEFSSGIQALEERLKRANGENLLLQKWNTYDRMLAQKQEKERELSSLDLKYPSGLPTVEECGKLEERWQQNNLIQNSLQHVEVPSESAEKLRELEKKFQNGAPMVEDTHEIQEKISHLTIVETDRKNLEHYQPSDRERELSHRFENGVPSEGELQEKRTLAEEIKRTERMLQDKSAALIQRQSQTDKRKFNGKLCLLVVALILLVGGVASWFVLPAAAIALWIVGGVCLVAGLLMKNVNATMPHSNDKDDLLSLQSELDILKEELLAFTKKYEPSKEDGVSALAVLEEDVKSYYAQTQAAAQRLTRCEELAAQASALRTDCVRFLEKYEMPTQDLQAGLNQLTMELALYRNLQEARINTERKKEEFSHQLTHGKNALLDSLKRYGLNVSMATMDGLKEIERAVRGKEALLAEIERLTHELEKYQTENGLTERPTGEKISVDELQDSLSELREKLVKCDRQIADTERQVEGQSDLENELAEKEEKLAAHKEKYQLILDTISALTNAEQALKDKYIAPIKTRFLTYAESLEKVLGEKVSMDKDFKIVFERGGETRNDRHLSAGERTLLALCLRLALLDNMYEGEQPFIIMDDPFVYLDEEHMNRTKELLQLLAEKKQILYFCCHESRKAWKTSLVD